MNASLLASRNVLRYVSPYRELTVNLHYTVRTLIVERKASYSLCIYIYIYDTYTSVTDGLAANLTL